MSLAHDIVPTWWVDLSVVGTEERIWVWDRWWNGVGVGSVNPEVVGSQESDL